MAHLGNTIVNGALRVLGGENVDTINGVTVGSSPKFTDASVTQTATTTDANYEVLFSATADNTTRTEGARKTTSLRFNPSTGSLMEGQSTVASGTNSHAEGSLTTANGTSCHAEGGNTKSVGDYCHSEGYMTTAINGSHAEGNRTIASNQYSHSEGYKTGAKGGFSHAEGDSTIASGDGAHAEGYKTSASGKGAHAEGGYTTASTGGGTIAGGENSHAEGYGTTASGQSSHAEGYNTLVVKELYDSMYGSHAEGYQTTCGRDGSGKHAEGFKTSAYGTGSHSEGVSTIANGESSHAEGESTTASGIFSHAEGYQTIAQGSSSHAEGNKTIAVLPYSHAEGEKTTAYASHSHASGLGTSAGGTCQTVIGKYNVADTTSAFIIGNGTSASAKSNAFKVDFSGNFDAGNFKSEHSEYYGNTNLNSLPCTGYYWGRENVPSIAAGNLAPDNTCGAITWKYNALFEDQIAMDSYNSGALFTRSKTNGAWSTWKKVKMSDDQYVCSGVEYDPSRERVTKVTASDGWNSQIYSKRGYKNNVYVRFKAGQTNKAIMVGLNSDPTTDANYASIDFCWYLQNNGTLAIYESGTGYITINSGTNPTYIAGEEFYIEVHDNKVYYYRNNDYYSKPKLERVSTNKTTSSSSNFNKLYLDSSFHDANGYIYDVEFGVTTQTASGTLIYNEAGQGLLNHFPIAVSSNIVSSTTGAQQTTLQTFPYFSYCPPYHSLSVGEGALASKFEAFALGYNVEANANSSFATGEGTVASGECQTVIGKYNIADTSSAFIIGNGTADNARSNALKIDSGGNFYTDRLMLVGKNYSRSTSTPGTWTAMCRSDQAGSPTCPTNPKWWNIISLGNWNNSSDNWVSQLAIATQDDPQSGVWWRCNNTGGTDISNSTWHRLAEGNVDGSPRFLCLRFTLDSSTSLKWYKVLSRPIDATIGSATWKGILTVSAPFYAYTSGGTKSFTVESQFRYISLSPLGCSSDVVDWIRNWRVTNDGTNQYLEFQCRELQSPYTNDFKITYLDLSNSNQTECLTFYTTLTQSNATTVESTFVVDENFRARRYGE